VSCLMLKCKNEVYSSETTIIKPALLSETLWHFEISPFWETTNQLLVQPIHLIFQITVSAAINLMCLASSVIRIQLFLADGGVITSLNESVGDQINGRFFAKNYGHCIWGLILIFLSYFALFPDSILFLHTRAHAYAHSSKTVLQIS